MIRFSVVIPARNEADYLDRTLDGLSRQDFAGGYEVIVVDNGSTDGTAEIARRRGVRVIREDRHGVCQAREAGTRAAAGEIVISTDADTCHPVDWLSRIDRAFRDDPGLVAVGGGCRFSPATWWSRAYPMLLFGAVGLSYRLTGHVWYVSAANLAFRRDAWPGYDLRLTQGGDELDLLRRLRQVGRIRFDPTLLVETSARRLARGFWYSALVTFGYYYLLGYLVNRIARRTVLPMAPEIRPLKVRLPLPSRSGPSRSSPADPGRLRPAPPVLAGVLTAALVVAVAVAAMLLPIGAAIADGMEDGVQTVVARFGHR